MEARWAGTDDDPWGGDLFTTNRFKTRKEDTMTEDNRVQVHYWIPVIATVDLDQGKVIDVDEWPDELGSCWPDVQAMDGAQVPSHVSDQALAIAEGTEWPERNRH